MSLRKYVSRLIITFAIGISIIYAFEYYFHIQAVSQTLMALFSALGIGFIHELLHYAMARKLGYQVEWYQTRILSGFIIDIKNANDSKRIAYLPYYICLPLSGLLICFGCIWLQWGLMLGGGVGIVFHCYTIFKEGQETDKKHNSKRLRFHDATDMDTNRNV